MHKVEQASQLSDFATCDWKRAIFEHSRLQNLLACAYCICYNFSLHVMLKLSTLIQVVLLLNFSALVLLWISIQRPMRCIETAGLRWMLLFWLQLMNSGWLEDARIETKTRKDRRGMVSILSASPRGNWNQLCLFWNRSQHGWKREGTAAAAGKTFVFCATVNKWKQGQHAE